STYRTGELKNNGKCYCFEMKIKVFLFKLVCGMNLKGLINKTKPGASSEFMTLDANEYRFQVKQ
ncbi:hypothetical protein STEG23_027903, partial [Scotinomys teguina]